MNKSLLGGFQYKLTFSTADFPKKGKAFFYKSLFELFTKLLKMFSLRRPLNLSI